MSAIISKVCGNCADYCSNCGDPTCRETGQPVGYLWVRECWKEKSETAGSDKTTPEKKARGRRPQYPPVVDPETGQVVSKRCRICGEYKTIEEFYKNHTHKDGHGDECRLCHNQKTMEAARRRRAAKKAQKPSPPKKKENPAPSRKKPVKKEADPELAKFTDFALAEELSGRGWDVSLRMSHSLWEV